jgi:hypothetical protein
MVPCFRLFLRPLLVMKLWALSCLAMTAKMSKNPFPMTPCHTYNSVMFL